MAEATATRSSRGHHTICLPIPEETDRQCVEDPEQFRRVIDASGHISDVWTGKILGKERTLTIQLPEPGR